MKYDIAIIGAGPAGLMAAKTAAENGLKVVLVDRKKNITEINRACLQVFYIKWISPDAYIEPVSVENTLTGTKFHFHGPGFTIDYNGPLKPYCNAVWISPSGINVYAFKNDLFGFYYDKEHFLAGLLEEVQKRGVEVKAATSALGAENTPEGVKVFLRDSGGDKILEARTGIAADGINSRIVETLGMNKARKFFGPMSFVAAYMEGIEPDVLGHETGWLSVNVPSVPEARLGVGLYTGDLKWVMGDVETQKKFPTRAHWFKRARVVKTTATVYNRRTSIREPVNGNFMIIGDAATPQEAWIQGAVACGYQAVKAIIKERNGQNGYQEYVHWWQKAFYHNDPGYFKAKICHYALNSCCNDEEVDYIYDVLKEQRVVPTLAFARKPEIIKKDRPELYKKVTQSIEHAMKEYESFFASFPADSSIFPDDPVAYLGKWRTYVRK